MHAGMSAEGRWTRKCKAGIYAKGNKQASRQSIRQGKAVRKVGVVKGGRPSGRSRQAGRWAVQEKEEQQGRLAGRQGSS